MLETILEKYSIEVVVNRTKISRKNLEKLREKNFEGLTRPQAYGFVRILEREFGENFDDLKAEVDAWFKDLPSNPEPIFLKEEKIEEGTSKKWILLGLVIAVLLLGGYVLKKEFLSHPDENRTVEKKSLQTPAAPASAADVRAPVPVEKKQEAAAEAFVPPAEENPAATEPAAAEENVTQAAEETEEQEAFVPLENVALTPVVKLWFGTIDLKTKKRRAKVTASPYEIESRGKKLLVTGHGRFEISDAFGNLFKFNDAKKHYFLIDDGMVKEISSEEFRRLNGGKGW
ncbi:hypothetical protein [Hydrogenimonas urashimensis]|uniref:hypothetical protein n=1 Tax=Hydrogenimonas urashimensis TaxID=2740515 RepID=UPI0019166CD2|nr:hypothetical protein [Hydrogenimonas urashimensis]